MGWFSSRNKVKKPHHQAPEPPSFTDPPNVYVSRRPPPQKQPHCQQPSSSLPPYTAQNHYASQSQLHFQPAGYLPPPPGWNPPAQPVIVNQHYYLGGHPVPDPHRQLQRCHSPLGRFTGSVANLAKDVSPLPQLYDEGLSAWHGAVDSTAAVYDQVSSRFNNVMTLIDCERFVGNEGDLFNFLPDLTPPHPPSTTKPSGRHGDGGKASLSSSKKSRERSKGQAAAAIACSPSGSSYFSKVELYANSKLPMGLPPLKLYIPTWPLLCLAAQYSQRVYDSPRGNELDAHVSADWRTGTKAMCIKSVSMDHMNTIVFAIRGTASFMDWAVNLNAAPASPDGFLDDPGNLCHAGFLNVAKKMVRPVAARLTQLLREDQRRSTYSLLITGHSAGGAVASLLYTHMLSTSAEVRSELNGMTGRFRRIHCVTFGTPPVSLLPLTRPDRPELQKSLFLSFVNEGDPVVRADKAYVKSLVELLALPPPAIYKTTKSPRSKKSSSGAAPRRSRSRIDLDAANAPSTSSPNPPKPVWKVPPTTLSNAGRIIVLRSGNPRAKLKERKTVRERLDEGVAAVTCGEEQLRGMIWGDPVSHLMSLYAGRIEVLAVGAVTARK